MEPTLLIWIVVAFAAFAAVAFTVVPVIPGTFFPPLAMLAIGLLDGFDAFPWWAWVAQVLLGGVYLVVDNVMQVMGVRRAGGSKGAMAGGAVGTFAGPLVLAPLMGPFALLLGPPVGAVVGTLGGEWYARRQAGTARPTVAEHRRLSVGALIAFAASTVVKLGIVLVQLTLLVLTAL